MFKSACWGGGGSTSGCIVSGCSSWIEVGLIAVSSALFVYHPAYNSNLLTNMSPDSSLDGKGKGSPEASL
jgi:hypothetical protein